MDFDSVPAEKEDANRQKNLKTFVSITALFSLMVLIIFSWSSPHIPAAMEFFRTLKSVLYQRLYIFLLTNALVFAIYFSNRKNAGVAQLDLYDEYVYNSSTAANLQFPASEMKVSVLNRNPGYPAKKIGNTTRALVLFAECEIEVTETGRRYRRSNSESYERRTVAMRRELRRSETENWMRSMEEMSSEEFRILVESFIAKKKKDLREEDIKATHSAVLNIDNQINDDDRIC